MYEWIKALHVIAVISWMAGMLYLPRLFVYHCDAEIGSKQSETFKVMERRLLKAIINPAMIVTWLAGLYLVGSLVRVALVSRKASAGFDPLGSPRLFFPLREGLRGRPQSLWTEILSYYQRGADGAHGRNCDPRDRETVLMRPAVTWRRCDPACGAATDFLY
jgi:protoporphyrinogen IX oxidase